MQFSIRVPTSNRVASKAAIVEVAQAADELGFWAVSAHDHLIFNGWWIACGARDTTVDGEERAMYELLTTLSFLAGKTERVKLLAGVLLLPVREPILVAKQAATVDVLSDGRLILGVGVGEGRQKGDSEVSPNEMRLGAHLTNAEKEIATFRVPPKRGRAVNEFIRAMRVIWTDASATFEGEFVHFKDIEIFPKPVQPGGPPIVVGGIAPAALRRVVLYADGWMPSSPSPAKYAEAVNYMQQVAREAGKAMPALLGVNVFGSIADSDQEALDIFSPTMAPLFKMEDLLSRNVIGSPESVIRRLREYEQVGVNMVDFKPIYRSVPELIRMMELLAREVMPAFESRPVAALT